MADIEHSELPDELLHEPKGASTAAAGTVYVADGAGAGTFKRLPFTSLDFFIEDVNKPKTFTYLDNYTLTTTIPDVTNRFIEQITSDSLKVDVTNSLNHNFAELAEFNRKQNLINTRHQEILVELTDKLNKLIDTLKNEGLVA